jgi:branched-chain amino acid transport system ATP-binding protein
VPEGRAIFQNLTVRENLELGAYNHKNVAAMAESFEDVVKLFPRLGERMKQEAARSPGASSRCSPSVAR